MSIALKTAMSAGSPLYRKIALYKPEKMNIGMASTKDAATVRLGVHKGVPDKGKNSPSLR
jgi:hypothetical protein